jgi:4-hydroxy-tetrahydrodipicolinate synthase
LHEITTYVIERGVHGLMPVGGTGEFPNLCREEKKEVIRVVCEAAAGRVPVIAGTAACSTQEVITLSNDAVESGTDAVIVTAPYYFRLPQSSLIDHYRKIGKSVSCPVVVYNNPLYTGNNLTPETIAALMAEENIIGVKQSNSDMGQLVELIRLSPPGKSICTGIDSQFFPALCVGASGIYSTAACAIPEEMVRVFTLTQEGKFSEARQLHMTIQALNCYFEYDPGYVAPVKEALNLLGLPGGPTRLPLPGLTADQRRSVGAALKAIRTA